MCGITGIFNQNGKPVSHIVLQKMTDIVRHRGPDGEGIWVNGYVGFGHRRLSIIDLSEAGAQPMQNDDGDLTITYNGEVFNFKDIRRDLKSKGYSFRSQTDTEVILKAYEEWGADCLLKFNGMFAFAIWDNRKKTLFLTRDRYGVKPLYYYFKDGLFLFGSEIKSLLQHPAVSVSVSIPALNEYFSFQNIFSDLTLFDGIKLLPPATSLTITLNDNKLRRCKYWDYHFEDDNPGGTREEYLEELERLFEQAVTRQLVSDVEVGSYLSGGMDSGSITCVAASHFPCLKSFTGGFDLSSASGLEMGFDERQKAEFLSNKFKTEHYEVVLKAGDMERVMKNLVWHLEDLRVGQSYPNFYVSRLASKFVKVVLSGAGGDELFAGYPWRYYRAIGHRSEDDYMDNYYRYWQRLIPDRTKPNFFRKEIYPDIWNYQTKDVFRSVMNGKTNTLESKEDYINRSLYFEITTFMHGLLVVEDKLSMAHGLETRVPFLDNDLVDFAMKLPVRFKLNDIDQAERMDENEPGWKSEKYVRRTNDGKVLLRQALQRYLPIEYTQGAKQGFSAPDASWFKGESIDYVKDFLFNNNARIYEFMQPGTVQTLLKEHFSGIKNRRLLIWSLLSFEQWNQLFN
ncbi:MAG: asparagine synthase (glutamine-hydrolyzing) [Bacteroidetes bacterium]|nr:asparagine synthase (glutamine-hydrolyzing) [Bacteroidota bacterium]